MQFRHGITPALAAWLCILQMLLAGQVWAADWRDSLSPAVPGDHPPLRPLKATYLFGWSALTAAEGEFDFSRAKAGHMRLSVTTRTTGAVRALWRMDAEHIAICDAATLRPIRLQQTEIYKGKTEISKANFEPDAVERWQERKPPADTPPKWRRFKFGPVFDLQTALLFIRSQRLRDGEVYRLVVFPSKAAYLAEVEVIGRETLKLAARTYPAIKCQLRLQGISKEMMLEPHAKFKQAFAWLSDDRDRLLLKVKADIFVGSVWAELETVKFTDR